MIRIAVILIGNAFVACIAGILIGSSLVWWTNERPRHEQPRHDYKVAVAMAQQSTFTMNDAFGVAQQIAVKTNPDGTMQFKCAEH